MEQTDTYDQLRYQYEILLAKLEIRDHYYESVTREIYENTGQLLSLVRVKISTIGRKLPDDSKNHFLESGELLGKAIFSLRRMCESFFPEIEFLNENGLINALRRLLKSKAVDGAEPPIEVQGVPFLISRDGGMVFYMALIEIIEEIYEVYGPGSMKFQVIYSKMNLNVILTCEGEPGERPGNSTTTLSSLVTSAKAYDRIRLIGGKLTITSDNENRTAVDVSVPFVKIKAA